MQITITDIQVEKVKTYQVANVAYQDYRGEAKTWKLMSFSNPSTFAVLKNAKQGEVYEITTGKNDKDYTVWTSAAKIEGSTAPTAASAAPKAAWVPDSDRQRLIVKQSSVAQAVASIGPGAPVEDYLARAEQFVQYVFDVPALETEQE